MHVQFCSQNPLAWPITNSRLISKVLNGSTLILVKELLKFGSSVRHCAADGPASVWVIVYGYPTGREPSTPFKHLSTAHAFFPERLSDHCQGLHHTFSGICTKFDAHSLFFYWIHHEITSAKIHDPKQRDIKMSTSTWLCVILYTDSQDMLVLSSTIASHYYNCCTDGSTSPGNHGHHLVQSEKKLEYSELKLHYN
jgi:hypothetical protein